MTSDQTKYFLKRIDEVVNRRAQEYIDEITPEYMHEGGYKGYNLTDAVHTLIPLEEWKKRYLLSKEEIYRRAVKESYGEPHRQDVVVVNKSELNKFEERMEQEVATLKMKQRAARDKLQIQAGKVKDIVVLGNLEEAMAAVKKLEDMPL